MCNVTNTQGFFLPVKTGCWSKLVFGQNRVLVKTGFWLKPFVGQNRFLVKTGFWSEQVFGQNQFLGQIGFWSKSVSGQNCFLVKTAFWSKPVFVSNSTWSPSDLYLASGTPPGLQPEKYPAQVVNCGKVAVGTRRV